MKRVDLVDWLRSCCSTYTFDVGGVFNRYGHHEWPLAARDEDDLERALEAGGHLRPLPKEPAALANVLEVLLVDFLLECAATQDGFVARRGTERGYPDLELTGPGLGDVFHAIDVKVARRAATRTRSRTESRITLYTGNTYFRFPQLHWPGTFRAFDDYASHVDVLVIYTFNPRLLGRVEDIELIVQESWKIASKKRSSTTREYIGAVDVISNLRDGKGEFANQEEFYKFWRSFPFRQSEQVQKQLARLVSEQQVELEKLRRLSPPAQGSTEPQLPLSD